MAHSIHLSILTSQDHCDLCIHSHKNARYLNISQGRIMQSMVWFWPGSSILNPSVYLPLIFFSRIAGKPKSELEMAGQPPRVLSPEEQVKMRTVCRVCTGLSFYMCN